MTTRMASIGLVLGLAAAAVALNSSRAMAVEDPTTRARPLNIEQAPLPDPTPPDPPPPEPIAPAERTFLTDGLYYGFALDIGASPNYATDADFDVGSDWIDSLAFETGYRIAVFRFEAQLGIQTIHVSSLKLGPASPFPADDYAGSLTSSRLMANLYIEFPIALFGSVRPYAGWGRGVSAVHARYTPEDCYFGVCSPAGDDIVDDGDVVLAEQYMAGLTVASAAANLEYYFGYRRFETDDLKFRTVDNLVFHQDGLESHTVFIGVRLSI